jgi:hypothetical protein
MRQALWTAIDNWAPLEKVFKKKETLETKSAIPAINFVPAIADLPYLTIVYGQSETPWAAIQEQEMHVRLQVIAWFPDWSLLGPEAAAEELIKAALRGKRKGDDQVVPEVRRVCGQSPVIEPFSLETATANDGAFATRITIPMQLKMLWNPAL